VTEHGSNDYITPSEALLKKTHSGVTLNSFDQEVDKYLALPPMNPHCTATEVLLWWKEHVLLLPELARLAIMYLAIPVSSASSERMFSCSGNIVNSKIIKRTLLIASNVEKLVIISRNLPKLKRLNLF
jgi:hypothetical protein